MYLLNVEYYAINIRTKVEKERI